MQKPNTPKQAKEFLRRYKDNREALEEECGLKESQLRVWRRHAEALLYDIPEGHILKGVSRLEDSKGNVKQQWVKTDAKFDRQKEVLQEAADALTKDLPRARVIPPPHHTIDNLLSCYILTDYHFGMLAWGAETGADWNMDVAENLLINWFTAAIQAAPASKVGILAELGDLLHYDSLEALTPTSSHVLDADARFPAIVEVVIRVLRRIINMLAEKHEQVHIILAEGNHDLSSSVWLRALFAEKYEDNPRITVDNSALPFYMYEWGDTSLFFHHGHLKKMDKISNVFAGEFREVFGRTKYSYAHMGHLHHVASKEDSLMVVEQHPTLAARDAYAARGGYLSHRGASVITYSKESGETGRSVIRPEMVTSRLQK